MELKEFIDETLSQISEGVRAAQAREHGENVNADLSMSALGGNLLYAGDMGVATRVDFDVLVSAETSGGGKASLKVFSVGLDGGAEHTSSSASRINFSVHVRLPDGDSERARESRAKVSAALKKANSGGRSGSWMA